MSDARRAAEEALALVADRYPNGWDGYDTLSVCTRALRALLAEREDPVRRFGLSVLAAWWGEGDPGDLGGDDLQDFAEDAGLWHRVERHADGVECEWCQNDGSGCGELTEAGDRAVREADDLPLRPAPSPARDEVARLTALLHECNAVCLCGCPDGDHEADECGESCGHDDHECIRVPKSVLAYVETLRRAPARDEVREALAEIVEWALEEGPCSCDVDSPVECWLCRWHGRATAALSARPAVAKGDEVREAAEEWAAAEAEYDAVPAYSRDTDAFGRNMFRRQSARRRLLAALSRDAKGGER